MENIQKRTAVILNTALIITHSATIITFIIKKQYEFVAETAIVLASYFGLIIFEKLRGFRLENYIRLLLIITAVLHNFFGEFVGLYYSTEFFDKNLHMFGTFSFSLAGFSLINKVVSITPPSKLFTFILIVSLGALSGVAVELMEFLSDVVFKTYNQFGLQDTNMDMIFDLMGAVLAGLFCIAQDNTVRRIDG